MPRGGGGAAERARRRGRRCCGACACASWPAGCSTTRTLIAARGDRRRARPGRARPLVRDARSTGCSGPGHPAARSPVARRAGARPQARRTARRAPLHGAELRDRRFALPGFHPVEAYEAAIANVAPELTRRAEAGVGRGAAGVGGRAARDRRDPGDHGRRPGEAARRARRGSLSRSRPAPTASGGSEARARCARGRAARSRSTVSHGVKLEHEQAPGIDTPLSAITSGATRITAVAGQDHQVEAVERARQVRVEAEDPEEVDRDRDHHGEHGRLRASAPTSPRGSRRRRAGRRRWRRPRR